MKRKFLAALISIIMAASLAFSFTACVDGGNEPTPDDGGTGQSDPDDEQGDTEGEHTHTFADTWTFDAQNHWHAASCGHDERADIGAHVIEDGACTVCGAVLEGTEGLEYTLSQDESYYIVSGIGTATTKDIVIPSIYNDLPVAAIGDSAFSYCDSLTDITISYGVTSIGNAAFNGCTSLASIAIPDSVISISGFAFYNCSSLEYNTYDNALYLGNENNPYVVLIKAVNNAITSCQINSKTKIIYIEAFSGCTSLENITIPDGVTSIGDWAFSVCESLGSITISDTVTSIGDYAFSVCESLGSITISDTVTSIGDYAFNSCTSLKSITIGNGVASIGHAAFNGCTSLTNITLPDSVTSISDWTFIGCISLESITLPDSITSIGNSAFSDCTVLESIILPDSVISIGISAFSRCSSLTNITIPNRVTSIGEDAFRDCTSLEYNAYDNALYLGNENNPYVALIKTVNEDITDCQINNETKVIGGGAFSDCKSLTSITIPDGVTEIGDYAFSGCTSLTSITIPDGVTAIGDYAFRWCNSLESIIIPDSVTYIGAEAFGGCYSLERVYYTGNEEDWEKLVDGKNLGLEDVEIVYNYKG